MSRWITDPSQEELAALPMFRRKRRPTDTLEALAEGYEAASIFFGDEIVSILSLVCDTGQVNPSPCPVSTRVHLVLAGKIHRGTEACMHCVNALKCATDGRYRVFTLVTEHSTIDLTDLLGA